MDKMIAPNCNQITVTRENNHLERWICQMKAGCKRNRSSVRGVKGINIKVSSYAAGATDSRHNTHFFERNTGLLNGGNKRRKTGS
jgi:hypothetical protein